MNLRIRRGRGSAAAQCGEALPHRHRVKLIKEAPPPPVEAKPRRMKLKRPLTVSQRLTAPGGGKAAPAVRRNARKLTTCATTQRTANRSLLTLFLITVSLAMGSSLTVGPLPRVFSQNETPSPPAQPTPAASPSPSPTPPPNLHQWGAVTSFHGLPSDRTHAIAQTEFGVTWFATDGGLAACWR